VYPEPILGLEMPNLEDTDDLLSTARLITGAPAHRRSGVVSPCPGASRRRTRSCIRACCSWVWTPGFRVATRRQCPSFVAASRRSPRPTSGHLQRRRTRSPTRGVLRHGRARAARGFAGRALRHATRGAELRISRTERAVHRAVHRRRETRPETAAHPARDAPGREESVRRVVRADQRAAPEVRAGVPQEYPARRLGQRRPTLALRVAADRSGKAVCRATSASCGWRCISTEKRSGSTHMSTSHRPTQLAPAADSQSERSAAAQTAELSTTEADARSPLAALLEAPSRPFPPDPRRLSSPCAPTLGTPRSPVV
jgi:hypothetical protein